MKKKVFLVLSVLMLLVAIPVVAVALDLFSKSMPSSISIVDTRSPNLAVYKDSGCSYTLAEIDWGKLDLRVSNSTTKDLWAKNVGSYDFSSVNITDSLSADVGVITPSMNGFPLAVGEVQQLTLTLTVDNYAAPDVYAFNIIFDSTYG